MTDANPIVVSSDPIESVQQWFALMEQCCASVDLRRRGVHIRR